MAHKRVLITGAAGRIGQVLHAGLRDRYQVRLMYHRTVLPTAPGEEVVVGNIADLAAMEQAAAGIDAIVHLAGDPRVSAPWEDILEANIRGVYAVYEAAHRQGVRRVVFASTNHVTGYYEREGTFTRPDMPARPDSYYGASKAFGEDLGRYYADAFGLGVVCLRIGSFQPDEAVTGRRSDRILSTWLSHRDCVQLVWRGIEAEGVRFGIYYGISGNTRACWDLANARADLGYAPEDDAERLACSS
ncbi:MAG: NAD(P)-dependent oxidoreductase [Gemmatimonadota bacterium]